MRMCNLENLEPAADLLSTEASQGHDWFQPSRPLPVGRSLSPPDEFFETADVREIRPGQFCWIPTPHIDPGAMDSVPNPVVPERKLA